MSKKTPTFKELREKYEELERCKGHVKKALDAIEKVFETTHIFALPAERGGGDDVNQLWFDAQHKVVEARNLLQKRMNDILAEQMDIDEKVF